VLSKRTFLCWYGGIWGYSWSLIEVDWWLVNDPIEHIVGSFLSWEEFICFQAIEQVLVSSDQDTRVIVNLNQTWDSFSIDIVQGIESLWGSSFQLRFLLSCEFRIDEEAASTLVKDFSNCSFIHLDLGSDVFLLRSKLWVALLLNVVFEKEWVEFNDKAWTLCTYLGPVFKDNNSLLSLIPLCDAFDCLRWPRTCQSHATTFVGIAALTCKVSVSKTHHLVLHFKGCLSAVLATDLTVSCSSQD